MKAGDKIKVLKFDGLSNSQINKIIELKNTLTVGEADPVTVGENGKYKTDYIVWPEEFPNVIFTPGQYSKI
jgi:hypothetical protein